MLDIIIKSIICQDGTEDFHVELNTNTNPNHKVQAFVNCFYKSALRASSICHSLPINFILAQWGGESGWNTGKLQNSNQNWVNMIYSSERNPVGNIGRGNGGWALFEGREKFATAYAYFYINNKRYSKLIDYLKLCTSLRLEPYINTCARYIADAGFGGADHERYYNELLAYLASLEKRSNLESSRRFGEVKAIAKLSLVSNVAMYNTPNPASKISELSKDSLINVSLRSNVANSPYLYANYGWIDARFAKGWIKDHDDENMWWYLEEGYKYPKSSWKKINNKYYCFGRDGYLFIRAYIKYKDYYCYVNKNGEWLSQYDSKNPEPGYRVVEDIKKEKACLK